MKKYLIILFILIIVIISSVFALTKLKENIKLESETLADGLIKLYQGDESFRDNSLLSEESKDKIEEYLSTLKEKDNLEYEIDIEEIEFLDQDAPPVEIDPDATYVPEEETVDVDIRVDSKGIYLKSENTIAIKVNDIEFSNIGYSEIIYDGTVYSIYLEDMPETYEMIKNNPEYVFKYVETVEDSKEVRVYYESVITKHMKCIKVKNDGFKVTDFIVD